MASEPSNTNNKDDLATDAPRDDGNSKTDHYEEKEPIVDEEDDDEEEKEEEGKELDAEKLKEEFLKLDREQQQQVVDLTVDLAFAKRTDLKYLYHGLEDQLKPKGYEILDTEKPSQEKMTYIPSECKWL